MIEIGDTLISRDVVSEAFVCDLNACKGECCVQGDAGAPLEDEEVEILESIYQKVLPYLPEDGQKVILERRSELDDEGEKVTPLVDGGKCAYLIQEGGISLCGIERAFQQGDIDFKKPISCALYPIRIRKYRAFSAVNYDRWSICDPACKLGKSLNVKVYQFLKEPLIRKFGVEWYEQLEEASKLVE